MTRVLRNRFFSVYLVNLTFCVGFFATTPADAQNASAELSTASTETAAAAAPQNDSRKKEKKKTKRSSPLQNLGKGPVLCGAASAYVGGVVGIPLGVWACSNASASLVANAADASSASNQAVALADPGLFSAIEVLFTLGAAAVGLVLLGAGIAGAAVCVPTCAALGVASAVGLGTVGAATQVSQAPEPVWMEAEQQALLLNAPPAPNVPALNWTSAAEETTGPSTASSAPKASETVHPSEMAW